MKKFLQNRIVAGSLMFLLLDLAGGFLVLAPFLISIRSVFERSGMARQLWPIPSAGIGIEILSKHLDVLATSAVAAFTVYIVYMALRTYFAGGIYKVIVESPSDPRDADERRSGFDAFLATSSQSWMGFIKIAVAAILIYTVAGFLGITIARVFVGLGSFWMIAFFLFVMMIASSYLQILRIAVVKSNDNSVVNAIKGTRQAMAKSIPRLLLGNLSVALIGTLVCLGLWLIIKAVRGGEWNVARATVTIILEQLIVLVVCTMQALRINFNNTIVRKGAQDAVGRAELGGV